MLIVIGWMYSPGESWMSLFPGWRRIRILNHVKRAIPFKTDVIEILHQTPDIPKIAGWDKKSASGIRAAVSDIPTIDGG